MGIGNAGLTELSKAMGAGRLARLLFLDLNSNRIGDQGFAALASAFAGGAASDLETLYLHYNSIGDVGATAFASLVPEALARLQRLWLYNNRIGDSGLRALSDLVAGGGLASLKALQVEGNLAEKSLDMQQSILAMLKARSS